MDESFIGTITRDGRRTGQFYAGAVEFDQSSFCGHSGSNKSPRPPKTLPSKASYLPPRRRINPLRLPLDPIPTAKRPNRLRNDRLIITNALISTIRAACGRGFSIEELFFPTWVEINHEFLICHRFNYLGVLVSRRKIEDRRFLVSLENGLCEWRMIEESKFDK